MNLFSPLVDNLFQLPKAINSIIHRLPNEVPFIPNEQLKVGNVLYIPIGLTSNKKTLNLVLDDSNPHCLICGCSGSGKSICTNVIINGLLSYNVELYLIDYKVCELAPYSCISQCKMFEYEEEKITKALSNILDIIKNEYKQLLNEGKTHSNKYSTVKVLVIEELAQASKKDLRLLSKIASIGRACNWRVICTIQRGDANTMTPQLKCHFTNKICFKTSDVNNSKVVIDSDVCAYIKQTGRGYYSRDGNLIQFQGFYITEPQIKEIIAKHKRKITNNDNVKVKPRKETLKDINNNQVINNDLEWINRL